MSPILAAQSLPPTGSGIVKNRAEVAGHGERDLRAAALSIVEAGIARGDPAVGARAKIRRDGRMLWVDGQSYDLDSVGRIWVVGAGKASFTIAAVLEDILGDRIAGGLLATKKGDCRRLKRIEVIEAGHPVPDADSVRAGSRILDIVGAAQAGDLVFAPVTGGASSLAAVPPEGVSLGDLRELNELLLRCGAPIGVINVVRRHACGVKGGRLVAAIHPATAITLTLDTAPDGMPWPDMCLPDPYTVDDAVAVLRDLDLWDRAPASIRAFLTDPARRAEAESVKGFDGFDARMVFVGDPASVCEAAAARACELGFAPMVLGTLIEGEAREVGVCMAGIARGVLERGAPMAPPCALISGGETTVTIEGPAGLGGPNQEFVLAFAAKMGARGPYACASVDTDGTDGPTELAGGLVDGSSMVRARELGIDVAEVLRGHASADALKALGDAVRTGHTGTNLQNLRVILLGGSGRPAS